MLDRELAVYEARARTDAEAAAEPAAVLATNDLKIAVSEASSTSSTGRCR